MFTMKKKKFRIFVFFYLIYLMILNGSASNKNSANCKLTEDILYKEV